MPCGNISFPDNNRLKNAVHKAGCFVNITALNLCGGILNAGTAAGGE
jgi:hypothetical protein